MIIFRSLASSSAGNCYHVTDGRTELLLEAGLPLSTIKKALSFRLSSIAGCLITHEHLDHSKSGADIGKAGVEVYASAGTIAARGWQGHRFKPIEAKQQFSIGSWTILPFDVEHDVEEPLGFLMQSGDEKLLFLTDTYYCRYKFSGITHLAVECNYSDEILRRNVAEGRIPSALKTRIMHSHLALETVLTMLHYMDKSKLREVHLLHLSDANSDEELFKREVQKLTGVPVYVAGK